MSEFETRIEFQNKILAALGLKDVPVRSVQINISAGQVATVEISAYLRNPEKIRALGRAVSEFTYKPTGHAPEELPTFGEDPGPLEEDEP